MSSHSSAGWLPRCWSKARARVLLPSLYPERIGGQARMDAWLSAFGIDRLAPRDALLEAYAVAQLHQVALTRARHQGLASAQDLLETQSSRKWLRGG